MNLAPAILKFKTSFQSVPTACDRKDNNERISVGEELMDWIYKLIHTIVKNQKNGLSKFSTLNKEAGIH